MSSTAMEREIIIVGAGFVGLTLACAWAQQGRQVALIEARDLSQQQTRAQAGRALALSHKSCEILQQLTGPLPLDKPILQVEISEQGSFGKLHLRAHEEKLPALGYVIPAPELGAHLLQCARAQKNITWIAPATVTTLEQTADQISVSLNIGEKQTADLLVVAEGAQSWTREQCNFSTWTRDYQQCAIVANVRLNRACVGTAYQRFTPGATLALLPLNDQQATLVVTVSTADAARWQAYSDKDFLRTAQALLGSKMGLLSDLGTRLSYPLQAVFVEKAYEGRLLLMGNAAHTLNPIAAQGFNLSLRDIAALVALLQDLDLKKINTVQQALIQYQQARLADQKNMLQFTDTLVHISAIPALKWARSLGLLTLDLLPFAKNRLYHYLLGV